jgi:hypothetical protein
LYLGYKIKWRGRARRLGRDLPPDGGLMSWISFLKIRLGYFHTVKGEVSQCLEVWFRPVLPIGWAFSSFDNTILANNYTKVNTICYANLV